MAVSLDTLLNSADKASQYAKHVGVSDGAAKFESDFSNYIKEKPEPVVKEAQKIEQEYRPKAKKLDDYRQEAKQEVEEVAADIKESVRRDESVAGDTKNVDSSSDERRSDKASADVSAEDGVGQEDAKGKEVVAQSTNEPGTEVQLEEASKRGVEQILNAAVTGSSEGEKTLNPAEVKAAELLARGEKIVESQREAGALIIDQLQGSSVTKDGLLTQGVHAEGAGEKTQQQAQQQTQPLVLQLAAVNEAGVEKGQAVNVGAEAGEQVKSNQPNSAVNVARQSKIIAQQAVGEGAASVENDANTAKNQHSEGLVQQQQAATKSTEQLLAKLNGAKQVQQSQQNVPLSGGASDGGSQQASTLAGAGQQQAGSQNQQQNQRDAALQQNAQQVLNDGSKKSNNVIAPKIEEGSVKPDASQIIDSPKFKEYMKLVEVQGNARTNTQHGVTKAESVMAQIKFGMAAAAAKGEKHVTIQLYPKELGTVDVHMKISAGKGAEITMVADKADTASMLQREAQSLKEALNDALKNQNTQLNFTFREDGNGQGKYNGGTDFSDGKSAQDSADDTGESVAALHQMQVNMEKGVDLVI